MIRKCNLLVLLFLITFFGKSQNSEFITPKSVSTGQELRIDGLIKPLLDDFIVFCKTYNIEYHDKLFELKEIAVVDTLQVNPKGGTLGMLVRDKNNKVEKIVFSWMTLLDKEILKVVAFHEFGHYFLGYKHICSDCNKIMAERNSSYFEITKDWDSNVEELFINSPEYLKNNSISFME